MTTAETIAHLVRDEKGLVWIVGKNVKVMEVVLDHLAYGWSADEIHEQHSYLSLAEIHAALSFYYDHHAEFEAEMEKDLKEFDVLRASTVESPLQKRLRALARSV
ncbi:MAG: DUF433 domain-containing protein [Verrucomicrobiota bacterium]|nr:DUF433 domain-containing protein [Verrucomicrobiota bacterium]